jgi:hypothetical protein
MSFNQKEDFNLSRERIITEKVLSLVNKGKILGIGPEGIEDTEENVLKLKDIIKDLGPRLAPGVFEVNLIIGNLRSSGFIKKIEAKKEENKKVVKQEIFKTETEKEIDSIRITQSEITEEQQGVIEANLLYDETHKRGIFKDDIELNEIHDKSLILEKKRDPETSEHYYAFAKAGLIREEGSLNPEEVVERDLQSLKKRQEEFMEREPIDSMERKKLEKAKKIATIVERSLSYSCTEGHWYGERIRIELTCLFDDIKRGVDEIFLIEKDNEKHDALGLGVDATYRGLKSDQFKIKFFRLLESIKDGHKTKIKYFKDHNGKMMKEFAIPKIVLHFDINDVKEFVSIVRKASDQNRKEEIENSYLKKKVMNQIINSCDILADFAEESRNSIFRDYHNIINSIKELSWENKEIRDIININKDDEVSKYLRLLVEKFRNGEE